jgi:hypothetical protein
MSPPFYSSSKCARISNAGREAANRLQYPPHNLFPRHILSPSLFLWPREIATRLTPLNRSSLERLAQPVGDQILFANEGPIRARENMQARVRILMIAV